MAKCFFLRRKAGRRKKQRKKVKEDEKDHIGNEHYGSYPGDCFSNFGLGSWLYGGTELCSTERTVRKAKLPGLRFPLLDQIVSGGDAGAIKGFRGIAKILFSGSPFFA
jgi:hypothetical protein